MFSASSGTPHLVIIGKDSKLTFSQYGYMPYDDIRLEIESAMGSFDDVNLVNKMRNIILNDSKFQFDLDEYFHSKSGDQISYEITSNPDSTIAEASIDGSILTLNRGNSRGITSITIKGMTPLDFYSEDSFRIMTYSENSNIITFENGINSEFYYSGDAFWDIEESIAFEGSYSLKSGLLTSPEEAGVYTNSSLFIDFYTENLLDTLSFAYKISSEFDDDGLDVFVDDTYITLYNDRWSGIIDWNFAQQVLKEGNHTIYFDLFMGEYNSAGLNSAWIDNLEIPGVVTGVHTENLIRDHNFSYNYPNPFNNTTNLVFQMKRSDKAELKVFNIQGQTMFSQMIKKINPGMNEYRIDLKFENSGTYLYKIESENELVEGKFLYLK